LCGLTAAARAAGVPVFPCPTLFRPVRRGGILCPGVARRRRVGVAGRIGGAYLESVAAVGQAAIALRAHAGCEGTRVELASEAAAGLGGREAEARAAAGASGRRRCRDG